MIWQLIKGLVKFCFKSSGSFLKTFLPDQRLMKPGSLTQAYMDKHDLSSLDEDDEEAEEDRMRLEARARHRAAIEQSSLSPREQDVLLQLEFQLPWRCAMFEPDTSDSESDSSMDLNRRVLGMTKRVDSLKELITLKKTHPGSVVFGPDPTIVDDEDRLAALETHAETAIFAWRKAHSLHKWWVEVKTADDLKCGQAQQWQGMVNPLISENEFVEKHGAVKGKKLWIKWGRLSSLKNFFEVGFIKLYLESKYFRREEDIRLADDDEQWTNAKDRINQVWALQLQLLLQDVGKDFDDIVRVDTVCSESSSDQFGDLSQSSSSQAPQHTEDHPPVSEKSRAMPARVLKKKPARSKPKRTSSRPF